MTAKRPLTTLLLLLPFLALAHPGGTDKDGCHKDRKTGERHCHTRDNIADQYNIDHPPRAGDEGVFFGPAMRIVDGDTFEAKIQGVVMKFRLEGVDTPERDQPYGTEATITLQRLLAGKQVVLVPFDTDHHGRTVVRTWVGDLYVNYQMVLLGAGWYDPEYARDSALYQAEEDARHAKRGLWALPLSHRIEPWVWRKEGR